MKKTLLGILYLLACCATSFASHFSGAFIRYEYTGTANVYRVYLSVYQPCDNSGLTLPASDYVSFASSCFNMSRLFQEVHRDTLDRQFYCDSVASSCSSPASLYRSGVVHVYSDTVSLPPCSNWKISWTGGSRTQQIVNLANPGTQNAYVEAFLNNSAAVNSNAVCSNKLPYFVRPLYLNTNPFPAQDVDGDSLDYQFITPMGGAANNLNYASGYTLALPFGTGGVAQLNQAAQTIGIEVLSQGQYVLALKVNEYRNGQLIGYSTYDWNVTGINLGAISTPPAISTPAVLNVTTCPGQTNSVTLNFVDSVATDSVFVTATPPTMAGWSFSSTGTSAAGSGSTTITWTTPSSANPATLPYFFINVFAKDNACPIRGAASYSVLVRLHQCNTDSVWPGDANADYVVNMYDPLAVAIAYGQTGTTRAGASTTWIAQYTANWANSFLTGVNMKHADCDGNGTVNSTDLGAITANYGQVHSRGSHTSQQKTAGIPDLYFDLTGVSLKRGTTVTIPVKLGTAALPMSNVYGLATHISINGITLAATPVVSYPSGWLGSSTNTLNFSKNISTEDVEWAYARTDHQNMSGSGTVANITFTVPANAPLGQVVQLSFSDSRIIDKNGNTITSFNEVGDSAVVLSATAVGTVTNNMSQVSVVPNPSGNTTELQLALSKSSDVSVKVYDVSGKMMWSRQKSFDAGAQYISLPAAGLAPGIYMIRVQDAGTQQSQVFKWVKQ